MAHVIVEYKGYPVEVRYKWKNGDVIILDVEYTTMGHFLDYLEETTEGKLSFKAKVRAAADTQALRILNEGKTYEEAKEAKPLGCLDKGPFRAGTTRKENGTV